MAVETEDTLSAACDKALAERRARLRAQMDEVRARGNQPIQWNPITIKGEPLSVTIIRERRGDFDDDQLS
jgi:hypothetical protein